MSIILPCTCHHKFQNTKYDGKRLHNICERATGEARCTVCGKVNTMRVKETKHVAT